ncbi:phospholipase A [Vitreoscilla massiliensis]|uniref:Phospholipase A1 n=1 Tax=Vitreoscilla massiliensis TaxID=1689272 RepID=A0ABY4E2I8_9NEIS|nr:phospholipase A [Vitreoscilla massiliensis]UOO89995.1 phospholipase A [Vitreoscilla massiliensis]
MHKMRVMCAALVALSSQTVWADEASALLQCANIIDNTVRLACFDKVVGAQLPTLTEPAQTATAAKAVDVEKTVAAKLENRNAPVVFAESPADQASLENIGFDSSITESYTPLSEAWDLDRNHESGIFSAREHHALSLMPVWYNAKRNNTPQSPTREAAQASTDGDKNVEARMQISFKSKLAEDLFSSRADLWFGYTQVSHWQVYNQSNSAPFRNTDYEPELILTQPVKMNLPWGGQLRMVGTGLVHQSNGRTEPLSRSWNRAYVMAGMEWGKLTVVPRAWLRLDGDSKDDNPDIDDYMGYGDVYASYRFSNKQSVAGLFRLNPATGKGAVQLDYTFPIKDKLKGYVRYFDGYGMNLLDYNHYNRSIGFGIKLTDWYSL